MKLENVSIEDIMKKIYDGLYFVGKIRIITF